MENKMTPEDLLHSCCSKSEYRPNLQRPFLQGDYVIATDAHAILAIPKEECGTSNLAPLDKPDVMPYLNAECTEFMKLDYEHLLEKYNRLCEELKKLDFKCSECGGRGRVKWKYESKDGETHYMLDDCPICHGEGIVEKENLYNKKEFCLRLEVEFWLPLPRLWRILNAMRTFDKRECMLLRQAREHVPCYHIRENEFKLVIMPIIFT